MPALNSGFNEHIGQALKSSPHVSRRMLRYETSNGHVTLRGTVTSYFEKQMAQEAIRKVDGVAGIENNLQVSWHEQS